MNKLFEGISEQQLREMVRQTILESIDEGFLDRILNNGARDKTPEESRADFKSTVNAYLEQFAPGMYTAQEKNPHQLLIFDLKTMRSIGYITSIQNGDYYTVGVNGHEPTSANNVKQAVKYLVSSRRNMESKMVAEQRLNEAIDRALKSYFSE